jgi:hypothetical protein
MGFRGPSATGGQVALGRDWLVFSPWDMDRTRAWLVKWLGKAGVPHVGDVGILWSPTTWNPSPKNKVAFDDFLSRLPVPVS